MPALDGTNVPVVTVVVALPEVVPTYAGGVKSQLPTSITQANIVCETDVVTRKVVAVETIGNEYVLKIEFALTACEPSRTAPDGGVIVSPVVYPA
jgi:hypothetical protein